jgi:hypothetical protein
VTTSLSLHIHTQRWGYCYRRLSPVTSLPVCFCLLSFIPCFGFFSQLVQKLSSIEERTKGSPTTTHALSYAAQITTNLIIYSLFRRFYEVQAIVGGHLRSAPSRTGQRFDRAAPRHTHRTRREWTRAKEKGPLPCVASLSSISAGCLITTNMTTSAQSIVPDDHVFDPEMEEWTFARPEVRMTELWPVRL